jgi:nitrilase
MSKQVIRAAAVQMTPVVLDKRATLAKVSRLAEEAADRGAELIVFPEATIPVYTNSAVWMGLARFGSVSARRAWARYAENSVRVPSPDTEALGRAAQRTHTTLVIGVSERDAERSGGSLYNTMLIFGPDGALLGKHRKLVPTNHERMVWSFGDDRSIAVFDTPAGRLGGAICWENYMPLVRYAIYSKGARIYVAPTADRGERWLASMRHIAFEGRVFVISVCQYLRKTDYPPDFELADDLAAIKADVLMERDSVIVGPDGQYVAPPVSNREEILIGDLDLERVLEEKQLLDVTGHYSRPDLLRLAFNTDDFEELGVTPGASQVTLQKLSRVAHLDGSGDEHASLATGPSSQPVKAAE